MGTWGAGIFSNDAACDVRCAYRLALEDGLDDLAAQQRVLDEFADHLNDDIWNDGPLVWLALAKTQWQLGRLDEHVKAEALAVIDQGRDLATWEGSDLYGYRRAVLGRLRRQLSTPPPPRKRIRPPRPVDPEAVRRRLPYQEGSVFELPLRDGRSARGLVSDLDPGSGLVIAYFFGPAAEHVHLRRYQLPGAVAGGGAVVQAAEHDADQVPALGRTLLAWRGGARADPARRQGSRQGVAQPGPPGPLPTARQRRSAENVRAGQGAGRAGAA